MALANEVLFFLHDLEFGVFARASDGHAQRRHIIWWDGTTETVSVCFALLLLSPVNQMIICVGAELRAPSSRMVDPSCHSRHYLLDSFARF